MKILLFLLLLSNVCFAQLAVTGKWKTIDDNTAREKSIVEISERDGKIYGKVIKIFPEQGKDTDPICDQCDENDARYKKKIVGMEIIKDLVKADNEYNEGSILDPEDGKVYKCKIWREGDDLKVRGFWGPFYRTQTWKKIQR
jgi:uncharacterized protein (DUF2147 family)